MKHKPLKTFGDISVWGCYVNPNKNDPHNPPIKDKDIFFVNLKDDVEKIFPKVYNSADPRYSLGKVNLDKWVAPFCPSKNQMQAVRWSVQFALDGNVTYDMIKKPSDEVKTKSQNNKDIDLDKLIEQKLLEALKKVSK